MKTEELKEASENDSLHFDAHEFDGLRDTWKEAASALSRVEECIRERPLMSTLVAAGLGFAVGCCAARWNKAP